MSSGEPAGTEPTKAAPGSEVSARWARWRRAIDLEEYDARWQKMLDDGEAAHGEVDFVVVELAGFDESQRHGPVLDAGCGTGRVAIELTARGIESVGVDLDRDMIDRAQRKSPGIEWHCADLATVSLGRVFPVVVMAGNVLLFARPQDRDAIVANLSAHVAPGGELVAGFSLEPGGYALEDYDASCSDAGLILEQRYSTWERHTPSDNRYHVSVHRRS